MDYETGKWLERVEAKIELALVALAKQGLVGLDDKGNWGLVAPKEAKK